MAYSGLPAYSAERSIDLAVVETGGESITILSPADGATFNTNRPIRLIWTDCDPVNTRWRASYRVGAGEWITITETTNHYCDWTPPAWSNWPVVQVKVRSI